MSTSSTTYGTLAGSSYGITFTPDLNREKHPETPSGLIVTQAVQTMRGWRGQIIVDKDIVWESDPQEDGKEAVQTANARVVQAMKTLFEIQSGIEAKTNDPTQ